jgi:hypothetical protein
MVISFIAFVWKVVFVVAGFLWNKRTYIKTLSIILSSLSGWHSCKLQHLISVIRKEIKKRIVSRGAQTTFYYLFRENL